MTETKAAQPSAHYAFDDTPEFWVALARRMVRNALPTKIMPRWVAVQNITAHGSTYCRDLCRYFDLDPDEKRKIRLRKR